jgi:glycosyltransferase involved in cell wall biosynthesis
MPVLNEIVGLKEILPQIDRSLFHEILVIDGGSTDGTVQFCEEEGVKVLRQPKKGIPDAEDHAYHNTTGDIIILFTPDGNSLPELLPELCTKMRAGYDMVIVSRYKEGAESLDDGLLTAFGNKLFTWLVNKLFKANYSDVLVGFRGYQRSAIEKMMLYNSTQEHWLRKRFFYMNGWELGSAIRAAMLGLKVAEIPGSEPARLGGQSKLSIIKNGLGSVLQITHDLVYFKKAN